MAVHAFCQLSVFLLSFHVTTATNFPACTYDWQENQGFSYELVAGQRLWSHCNFPSPRYEQRRCGRTPSSTQTYFLCDPDSVFTQNEASSIDASLKTVQQLTSYQCTNRYSVVENFTVAIAAVQHLQIPDLSGNDTCVNICGELRPLLDPATRVPTTEELQMALETFTAGLARNWNVGSCDNAVVVTWWQNYSLLATGTQARTSWEITESRISSSEREAMNYIRQGQVSRGLSRLVANYRYYLLGFSPAWALLAAAGILLLLLFLFLACQAGKGPALGVFEDSRWAAVVGWIVSFLTTAWFVEHLMAAMLHLQSRVKWIHLLIPGLPFIACIIAIALWHPVTQGIVSAVG